MMTPLFTRIFLGTLPSRLYSKIIGENLKSKHQVCSELHTTGVGVGVTFAMCKIYGGGGGGSFLKSTDVVGSWFENLLQVINDQPLKLCSTIHHINDYLVEEY